MGANFVLQTTRKDEANARSIKILEAMLRSCSQMERLIRNFGDLSAIEGDSLELRLADHDAAALAEQVANGASEAAGAKHVRIVVTKPEAPIVLRCDHDRLQRGLAHLVDNAIHAAPDGSTVDLSVTRNGEVVTFHVIDRGPGIDEETKAHLFDRAWHVARAGRAATAFGLSIARGFARAHGGDIAFESRPGSTAFSLTVVAHPRA